MKEFVSIAGLIVIALIIAGCTGDIGGDKSSVPTSTITRGTAGTQVRMETTMGNITLTLYPDMPITAGNFENLARQGFYNDTVFHRVIDGFMIQGGDPTGTGRGGSGYTIQDEFSPVHLNSRGTISMANTGQPNSGGSQFFINLVDNHHLDGKHPVFGEVKEGMDVVDRIGQVTTDINDRPEQNVTILKITIFD